MPKALSIGGMVIAALILLLFALDLVLPRSIAPLARASWLMDIIFVLCAAGLGYLSWITFKEQP